RCWWPSAATGACARRCSPPPATPLPEATAPVTDPTPTDPATLAQIRNLPHSVRPVVVCDVDEVVLHFIRHLEIFLDRQGFAFSEPVYRLKGNIRKKDGSFADDSTVQGLITGFFEDECGNQQLVDGAAEALD